VAGGDDDTLDGGRGRDRLDGGPGVNDITADLDRDTIVPGNGQNRITRIRKGRESCSAGHGRSAAGRRPRRDRHRDEQQVETETAERLGGSSLPTAVRSHNDSHESDRAKLAITRTSSADPVPSAQGLTYAYSVKNVGTRKALRVRFYDTLPTGITALAVAGKTAGAKSAECKWDNDGNISCVLDAVFEVNKSSTVTIEAAADANPGQTVTNTVVATGGNSQTSNNTVNHNITQPLLTVTIRATDQVAYESDPSNTGTFEICRNEKRPTALTVGFDVGGHAFNATENVDYVSIARLVTIGADQLCAAPLTITAKPDNNAGEPAEYVRLTLKPGSAAEGYFRGNPYVADVGIVDAQATRPVVAVIASDASEADGTGGFWITVTPAWNDWPVRLGVTYHIDDAADTAEPTDYGLDDLSSYKTVTFPDCGSASNCYVELWPVDDGEPEGPETVLIRLKETAVYSLNQNASSATLTIEDNDVGPDAVTIRATDDDAREQGRDPGSFEICHSNKHVGVSVNYSTGGTAVRPGDYDLATASIPAGSQTGCVAMTVTPVDDQLIEPRESVVVTLEPGDGYAVGFANAQATVNIEDNDCTQVRLRKLTRDGDPKGVDVGSQVTFTATTQPPNPSANHGTYTWTFRELQGRGLLSDRPVLVAQTQTNRLTTAVTKSGQYTVTLVSCGQTTVAALTVRVNPTISINDVTVLEGNIAHFTVRLSESPWRPVTVDFATADGTAKANGDYWGSLGTVRWARGQATISKITIPTIVDAVVGEPSETFFVNLKNPKNATIADKQGVGTIKGCDCAPVQFGAEFADPALTGLPEKWLPLPAAERPTLDAATVDSLRRFTIGVLGTDVGTQFANRHLAEGMLQLYESVVEFGWTVEFANLSQLISPGPSHELDYQRQAVRINTINTISAFGTIVTYTSATQRADAVKAALAAMRAYTEENRAAQDFIRKNRETLIQQVMAKFTPLKATYLAAAQAVNPAGATSEGFDCALRKLATAYVDGVLMFLKMHWGATPEQGWRIIGNRFNKPWCGDWNNFFNGSDQRDEGGAAVIPSFWDKVFTTCPDISKYFTIKDAQWHGSMTFFRPQHNFMIMYPVGSKPWLREGKELDNVLEKDPETGDPMISNDQRIVILDPWYDLRPKAWTISEYPPPRTSLSTVDVKGITNTGNVIP